MDTKAKSDPKQLPMYFSSGGMGDLFNRRCDGAGGRIIFFGKQPPTSKKAPSPTAKTRKKPHGQDPGERCDACVWIWTDGPTR